MTRSLASGSSKFIILEWRYNILSQFEWILPMLLLLASQVVPDDPMLVVVSENWSVPLCKKQRQAIRYRM